MMLGEVDNVDGHYVATNFHALLIPSSSMYVVGQTSERHGNVTTMTWSGVPVRFNVRSALLGYLRVWPWFFAAACPFIMNWGKNARDTDPFTWVVMGGLVALALVAAFLTGRLPKAEKERLRIIGRITGLRIDPSNLQQWTREEKRDELEQQLTQAGVTITPEGLIDASAKASRPVREALYTFACYSGDTSEWRSAAAHVLSAIRLTPPSA